MFNEHNKNALFVSLKNTKPPVLKRCVNSSAPDALNVKCFAKYQDKFTCKYLLFLVNFDKKNF